MDTKDWLRVYKHKFCLDDKLHLSRIIHGISILFVEIIDTLPDDDKEISKLYLDYMQKLDELFTDQIKTLNKSTVRFFNYRRFMDDAIRGYLKNLNNVKVETEKYLVNIQQYGH